MNDAPLATATCSSSRRRATPAPKPVPGWRSAETHRANLLRKLGLQTQTGLVRLAVVREYINCSTWPNQPPPIVHPPRCSPNGTPTWHTLYVERPGKSRRCPYGLPAGPTLHLGRKHRYLAAPGTSRTSTCWHFSRMGPFEEATCMVSEFIASDREGARVLKMASIRST